MHINRTWIGWGSLAAWGFCLAAHAAEPLKPLALPSPQMDKGRPLMQVLKSRQSRRDINPAKKLPAQELANLVWAACGVNRPETGKRTAPTAVNWQEIDLYVAMADGLFLYEAKAHQLLPVISEDIRAMTGKQPFVQTAPVVFIFVVDQARMGKSSEANMAFYSATDTGYISQNIYLYCASEDLATVVVGNVDKTALGDRMKLRPEQKVIMTQPAGYPTP